MARSDSTATKTKDTVKAKKTLAKTKASAGDKKVLPIVASFAKSGMKAPEKKLIAASLNLTNIRSLDNKLTGLKRAGLVETNKSTVSLTQKGWEEIGEDEIEACKPVSNKEFQERLLETHKLTGKKRDIFALLSDGSTLAFNEVRDKVGPFGSPRSFDNLIPLIVKTGTLESFKQGKVKMLRLSDTCFPQGRGHGY